jgi:hypothetical protein
VRRINPRQSNDWIVLRPPALPSRIASTASCANGRIDREVRFGRVGLDLDVEAHVRTRRGEKLASVGSVRRRPASARETAAQLLPD